MGNFGLRALGALVVSCALLTAAIVPAGARPPAPSGSGDSPTAGAKPTSLDELLGEDTEGRLLNQDAEYITSRTAGDTQLSPEQAGVLRATAANSARKLLKNAPPPGPANYTGAWSPIGPNPIQQIARSDSALIPVVGRIGALAIRKDGTFILGAAQGGIWTYNPTTGAWTNRTDNLPSLATGALAVAPSNDLVVYDGTGEGALSGDSYFG